MNTNHIQVSPVRIGAHARRFAMTASALALGMATSAIAHAAEAEAEAAATAAPATDAAENAGYIGEITVTARYKKESAQDVPIAITAISASQFEAQGATTVKQVMQQLPSLNIQGFSGRNQTITIRGIGTNAGGTNDGLEQGVGLYVDGVYRPRTGSVITDLLEVQSIQLLRGPQGTLFGKNTVAGALDIQTREPTFKPEARGELTYGNYNQIRGTASLDAAINDDLAFRVSYLYSRRDGLIHNNTHDEDWDNQINHSARVDVLYQPTQNFKLRVIGDYSIQKGDMGFYSVAGVLPTTLANGTQVRGFYRRAQDVGYTPSRVDPFARTTDIDSSQYDKMPSWGVQARADLDTGANTLTSITAYRNWKWIPNYDGDQIGANVVTNSVVATAQQQFSQEFRLASKGERTIDYTAGLYFFWQKADDIQLTEYGRDAAGWLNTRNTPTAAVSTWTPNALDGLQAIAHVVPQTYSYAAYGQATWNISPAFRLTGGLRYTYEHKTGLYDSYSGGEIVPIANLDSSIRAAVAATRASLAPTASYTASHNTGNLSWNLVAAYDLNPDLHAYAIYSRGYKSPGINLVAPSNGVDIFVKPEKVNNYELGLKSRFLGGQAEVNLALFWTDVSNYQANYVNTNVTPVVSYITNVGDLRSRGVELDARAKVAEGLTIGAAGTYTDAIYRTYTDAPAQYLNSYLTAIDLSGRRASGTSKWAFTGNVEYVQPLGNAEVYLGGDGSYRSNFYSAVNLDPFSKVPGYAVFGVHAGVRDASGTWDLSFWVRNLFDKNYYNTKAISSSYGVILAGLGDPRLLGVTLKGRL